jgi:4-oxalocrotonate tautomerase
MPYVNIKITREGDTTAGQKAALIKGVTELLMTVLGKAPATTFVEVDEVEMEDWGVGGLPVEEFLPNPHAYERDLELVEKHILATGHFALETHLNFIAERTLDFLDRTSDRYDRSEKVDEYG